METTTTSPKHRAFMAIAAVVLLAAGLAGGYAWGHNADNSSSTGTARMNHGTASSSTALAGISSRASATGHNAADVTFAQMMVQHHQQALDMAKLADTRASSADVKALASKIAAAQQPEIDTMNSWLSTWGAAPSSTASGGSMSDMSGMGASSSSGSSSSAGMMSEADMTKLENMSGADFDKEFLTMMTSHHQGAISMAQDELRNGRNADALALASSITITQQAQVSQMQGMLTK